MDQIWIKTLKMRLNTNKSKQMFSWTKKNRKKYLKMIEILLKMNKNPHKIMKFQLKIKRTNNKNINKNKT